MTARSVAVLGATGSIGRQALDVIGRYPDRFQVFGKASSETPAEAIEAMVTDAACDIVLVAISGAAALRPTLAALRAGKTVALATKEVLVMAGELVMRQARPGQIRPVDSEHSAIWQCLWGERPESVSRLVLTASGGPFWAHPPKDLDEVTVEDALNHPRWSMGPKVTVDSATLMNKGLEIIEARHLFGLPLDRIDVVIHPQSTVHSLVEFVDGSTKAQLGHPDMRLPIAVALAYPERLPGVVEACAMETVGRLDFHPLDEERFPAVRLARQAAAAGGSRPAVLNAANEAAVQAFLAHELPFGEIVRAVEEALSAVPERGGELDGLLEADSLAREYVQRRAGKVTK